MTTQLFFGDVETPNFSASDMQFGTNLGTLVGGTTGWITPMLRTTRDAGATNVSANTVNGLTAGIEIPNGTSYRWVSPPLAANQTISGTITLNLWASENNMSANVAINAIIERVDTQGGIVSTIANTARITEVAVTTAAVNNFTVTPTSTNMLKGERFCVRVYMDDVGTMATGFTATFYYAGTTAAVSGDSYIQFNETFSFQSADPAGSTLYLTDTTGPAVGANIEKEMWTSRGSGVDSIVTNTVTGWTAPIQWTNSGGGTAVEWYSKQLTAFTLSDVVKVNLRAAASSLAAVAGIRAELAVCNGDGSGATVWGGSTIHDVDALSDGNAGAGTDTKFASLTASEAAVRGYITGANTSVTSGQRLRLRVFVDDSSAALVTGHTCTLWYDGTSGGASGDSFIVLGQSVTEYTFSHTVGQIATYRRSLIYR